MNFKPSFAINFKVDRFNVDGLELSKNLINGNPRGRCLLRPLKLAASPGACCVLGVEPLKSTKSIIPSEALAESRDLADIIPELPILNILWM